MAGGPLPTAVTDLKEIARYRCCSNRDYCGLIRVGCSPFRNSNARPGAVRSDSRTDTTLVRRDSRTQGQGPAGGSVSEHPAGTTLCCRKCEAALSCYDQVPQRQWRHSDGRQFQTILHAHIPEVNCRVRGVNQANVPWAEIGSRFTIPFERFSIDVLPATQMITVTMSILGTKWDQTWAIACRAVVRGQARKETKLMPRLGIDEKAFAKGHSDVTLPYNPDNSTVEAISDSHVIQRGIDGLFQLSDDQVQSVEAIAMDMSATYVKATEQAIPPAEDKIVHKRL